MAWNTSTRWIIAISLACFGIFMFITISDSFRYVISALCAILALALITEGRTRRILGSIIALTLLLGGIYDLLHPSPVSDLGKDLFVIGLAAVYLGKARFGLGKTDEDEDED